MRQSFGDFDAFEHVEHLGFGGREEGDGAPDHRFAGDGGDGHVAVHTPPGIDGTGLRAIDAVCL
ncbi:MAG: hypothetical protein IPK33_33260 [Gemmatimonadetes bacterium]|nr:hypothetical protein [Gemmatimonadota bacterium]